MWNQVLAATFASLGTAVAVAATGPDAAALAASAPASSATAAIAGSLNDMANALIPYALTLAMVGAFTMAIQEAAKKLFNLQPRFHRTALARWLAQEAAPAHSGWQVRASAQGGQYAVAQSARTRQVQRQHTLELVDYDAHRAFAQLLQLTTGVPADEHAEQSLRPNGALARNVGFALFELELARLMTLIQEAADVALKYPRQFPDWFGFVVRGCDPKDVQQWLEFVDPQTDATPTDPKAAADLYARMQLMVRRQLDSFQTVTSFRWREWNQLSAWALGFVILLVAQFVSLGDRVTLEKAALAVAAALAGGILAPVAKDLVDALRRVKTGG